MRLIHDPDEEPQAKPGEFPDPKPPRGRAWLLRLIKRNWLMLTVMGGVVSLLAVVSIFLAVRAAKMPIQPVQNQTPVTVTPEQRSPSANMEPLPGAVPSDANGNPITSAQTPNRDHS